MTDEPVCRVTITAPDPAWLLEFSRQLVTDRLAAGAHNITPIRAVYRWDNQINDKPEAMLICHTKMSLVDEIVQRVNDQHPYVVPCVIAHVIDAGNPPYLQWIRDETR